MKTHKEVVLVYGLNKGEELILGLTMGMLAMGRTAELGVPDIERYAQEIVAPRLAADYQSTINPTLF